jgi:autotransporter-associated beta strand protein
MARDGCWKVSQGHVRSLTGAAVSRRTSLRIIHTSFLTLHRVYRKRALLLGTASLLAIGAASTGTPAHAQNATWLATPGSFDFDTAGNWTTGTVPTGTASFGTSLNTSLTFSSATTTIGGWTFNAGASAYIFTIANPNTLTFSGAGIVINGGSAVIANNGYLNFQNSSSAGSAAITNNNGGFINFLDNSAAGSAAITNNGSLNFLATSTAGSAVIANNNFGFINFSGNSTAGSATITNNGSLNFLATSTAGSAVIFNANGINFLATSTAGSAAITNNGNIGFESNSTAGSAAITNNGVVVFNNLSTGGSAAITNYNGGNIDFNNSSTAGSAAIINNNGGSIDFFSNSTAGSAAITNNGNIGFESNSTAGSAAITNNSVVVFNNLSTAGSAAITNNSGGTVDFSGTTGPAGNNQVSAGSIAGAGNFYLGANQLTVGGNNLSTTVSGVISDCGTGGTACSYSSTGGSLVKVGTGTLTLTGANTYSGGTTINGGTLAVSSDANLGAASGGLTFNGGTLQWGANFGSYRSITLNAGGGTFDTQANTGTLSGDISGSGGLTKIGSGTLILSGANTYTGGTTVSDGTLQVGNTNAFSSNSAYTVAGGAVLGLNGFDQTIGSLAGSGAVTLGGAALTTGNDNTSTTFSGAISGTGGLTKIGSGALILSGLNTYTGATSVNGGTLEVDGSIANSQSVNVNSGATLSGTGIVDPATTTIMSGGTLAPGNASNPTGTLTITGNLAFQSGALYLVQLTPSAAASTNVTGTATLGGATVNANFANGSYISKQYTILTAGSVSGTFSSLVNTDLPANFTTSLSYDPTHAYLNLVANFGSGLNINQQNVANALTNFFNATGGIPMVFGTLSPGGLSQVSGETATGSQQATFDAMNLFMGVLTDPFVAGRGDGATFGAGATIGYASTQTTGATRDAYAMFTKAPPAGFEQHWSVWAAGYGGSQTTDGNASLGSNSTTSSVAGTVVGADYRISPYTLAGFALAGGGTSFSVVGSGSGHSDLFQAGAFIRHTVGPAYISAALAYGWQDITTNRTVTAAGIDQLRAEFNANAFSGRLEGGYRFVSPWVGGIGITPYLAAQFTTFDLPAYAEQATVGSNAFALAYDAKDVTDARSEIGIRTDKSWAMQGAILTLRSRFAWAHDFDPDRSIAATFQTLPGASFTVNGAAQAHDSALTTASVEMKWVNGWSAAATFEGEFSNVTSSYAGKGVVRYAW